MRKIARQLVEILYQKRQWYNPESGFTNVMPFQTGSKNVDFS
jgi:hypothetical protein